MLIEYVEEALKRASYSIIEDDEPYYGEIEDLPGVVMGYWCNPGRMQRKPKGNRRKLDSSQHKKYYDNTSSR